MAITVLLAEDSFIVGEGLRTLLDAAGYELLAVVRPSWTRQRRMW